MIAELGHFCLNLALGASLAQAALLLAGVRRGDAVWMAAGRHAAVVHAAMAIAAFAALIVLFVSGDFSVRTVAANSRTGLPVPYRASALWAGQEGAMLLWVTLLALWTLALRFASWRIALELSCRALGILGLLSACLLALLIATSNPFARLLPAPLDGIGVNPVLLDPAMALHPPLLYAGWGGLSVVFALALAALVGGRLDAAWARGSRPWALAAWSFLTLGTGVGALWAYREPGVAAWWSWDVVEITSLLTWLAVTALLHALAVTEKRGLLRRVSVLLAILAFSLALFGMTLVRSGVLASPRAFAIDPRYGAAILALPVLLAGIASAMFIRLSRSIDGRGHFEMISREAVLLAGNAVLLSALGAILLGTLYPVVSEALGLGRLSVGASYYTAVFATLMFPGLVLLGPAARLRWGSESAREAVRDAIRPALATAIVLGLAVLAADRANARVAIGTGLSAWIAWHVAEAIAYRLRCEASRGGWNALRNTPWGFYATHLAHFGVAVLIAGVALSSEMAQSARVVLAPGASESAAGVRLRSDGTRQVDGGYYRAVRVRIVVQEGERETVLEPELRHFGAAAQPVPKSDTHMGLTRDLHVTLGEVAGAGAWVVRVQVRPFMAWIWGGGLLILVGGLLAAADRRYRVRLSATADETQAVLALAGSATR